MNMFKQYAQKHLQTLHGLKYGGQKVYRHVNAVNMKLNDITGAEVFAAGNRVLIATSKGLKVYSISAITEHSNRKWVTYTVINSGKSTTSAGPYYTQLTNLYGRGVIIS